MEQPAVNLEAQMVRTLPPAADVVVIGGGIVGAASAFWLAQAGLQPLLIERGSALATATTAASAHCIRAQFSEPENVAMMRESLAIFEGFAGTLDLPAHEADIGLRQQGYLFASTEPDARPAFAARVDRQRALGLADVELLDGDDARRRYPWLAPQIAVAAFRAADGWVDGCRAAVLFARASRAPIALQTEAIEIERDGGRVTGVRTSRGRVATETVVLATGPFAGVLAGEPLPITPLRRNRLIVAAHPEIPQTGPLTIDADTGAHWRPHRGGALAAWGRPEPGGSPLSAVPPDPTFPDLILHNPRGIGRLSPFWRELAPRLTASDLYLTAGQYTMTPDHKPLIGPAAATAGLWFHTGYSGHGIMGSPSGGRLLADLVTGRLADTDNPFRPGRFAPGSPPPEPEQIVL